MKETFFLVMWLNNISPEAVTPKPMTEVTCYELRDVYHKTFPHVTYECLEKEKDK